MWSSGLPVRLRLFVDPQGEVADIRVLQASDLDAEAVERLKRMFFETRFLPGKKDGVDVAAFMDIELQISDVR